MLKKGAAQRVVRAMATHAKFHVRRNALVAISATKPTELRRSVAATEVTIDQSAPSRRSRTGLTTEVQIS